MTAASESEFSTGKSPSLLKLFLLRWGLVFFTLSIFSPYSSEARFLNLHHLWLYEKSWNTVLEWVGKHLFGINLAVSFNGSGDNLYNYVELYLWIVLATMGALLWTILNRKQDPARLYLWLRDLLRFGLGISMIVYGAMKVFPVQFGTVIPGDYLLSIPIGQFPRMQLLWLFMASSETYTCYAGMGELIGGLLLLASRRTTLLGACISAVVVSQVVMLNYCYAVPVKLYSSKLLLMALLLILKDAKRLSACFFFHQTVKKEVFPPRWSNPWAQRAWLTIKLALIFYFAGNELHGNWNIAKYQTITGKPFYGTWRVETYEIEGIPSSLHSIDSTQWKNLFVNEDLLCRIEKVSQETISGKLEISSDKKTFTILPRTDADKDKVAKQTFTYDQPDSQTLILHGPLDNKSVLIKLHHLNRSDYPMLREFHWIISD